MGFQYFENYQNDAVL